MPPRGSTRGKSSRGRGGRGGKASASSQPTEDITAPGAMRIESEATNDLDTESQSQSIPETSTQPEPMIVMTPQQDGPSPNSSPAPVPTETPAPTPVRTPRVRPEEDALSAPPAVGAGRGSGSVTSARGGTEKKESKFKPRNVRRQLSEREELAREEMKRKEVAAAAAAREEARATRAKGRGQGRGRGDAMGRGRDERKTTATGTFGVVPEALAKKPSFGAPSSGTTRASGSGTTTKSAGLTVKKNGVSEGGGSGGSASGSGHSRKSNFDFIPEPEYPDDENGPRIDIESINISSDDDLPIVTGVRKVNKGKTSQKGGLKPVRLYREEHKERIAVVNTEPSTKPAIKQDENVDASAVDGQLSSQTMTAERKEFKGVYDGLEVPPIKVEPSSPDLHASKVPIASPEISKKQIFELADSSTPIDLARDSLDPTDEAEAKRTKTRKLQRPSKKHKKPVLQTEEDKAEYQRHLEDVEILARELGGMQANMATHATDGDGDVAMGDGVPSLGTRRDGRLYLFQFPPVLPKLYNPLTGSKLPNPDTEGLAGKGNKDVAMSGIEVKNELAASIAADGKETKTEEDLPLRDKKDEPQSRDEIVGEEGYIGKLVVRESGKVELSWGGTSLAISRGVDAGFLTTGLVVDKNERAGGLNPSEGKAFGMGKVMGKFVVTPDWEKM